MAWHLGGISRLFKFAVGGTFGDLATRSLAFYLRLLVPRIIRGGVYGLL